MTKNEEIERFIKLLKFPDPPEKNKIEEELKAIDEKLLFPALVETLSSSSNTETKHNILKALQFVSDDGKLHLLLDYVLNEDEKSLKLSAIRCLAVMEQKSAIDTLEKIVNRSADKDIIQVASQAIQIIQGITPKYSVEEI